MAKDEISILLKELRRLEKIGLVEKMGDSHFIYKFKLKPDTIYREIHVNVPFDAVYHSTSIRVFTLAEYRDHDDSTFASLADVFDYFDSALQKDIAYNLDIWTSIYFWKPY